MLSATATLALTLLVVLFPVLTSAAMTAFHAVSELRRPRTRARAERDRIRDVAEPITASA